MSIPLYTPAEARSRETFLALMWAFSYPGRIYELPENDDPFRLVAETLLDLETSCFTPDRELEASISFTGAKTLDAQHAAYHFYPSLLPQYMPFIQQAHRGSMLYLDAAATLIVGCEFGSGIPRTLTGPGIPREHTIQISGLDESFWDVRATVCLFPLGWDIYLLDGRRVMGLPRSIRAK